ncbi:hypothetical protein BJY59DRAFT_699189 [Rhodotorula toruloides]
MTTPNEAPPAYSQQDPSHLAVPSAVDHSSAAPTHRRSSSAGSVASASSNYTSEDDRDDGAIPDEARQSILDEQRPLPEGWRREFDANSGHYFYVDTLAKPPRSIWTHPLDDVRPRPFCRLRECKLTLINCRAARVPPFAPGCRKEVRSARRSSSWRLFLRLSQPRLQRLEALSSSPLVPEPSLDLAHARGQERRPHPRPQTQRQTHRYNSRPTSCPTPTST